MYLIEASHITKIFEDTKALDDVSLNIESGKITGLVGPDGAGKTTFIRLFAALLENKNPNSRLKVLGLDTTDESNEIQKQIGYMPQKFGLYEDLTVLENLELYANLQEISLNSQQETIKKLLVFTSLENFTSFLARDLSGGMKQKLGLACALIKKPKLLLLDEPGVGVDPISRRELWSMVQELIKENKEVGVVWSTAYLDEAALCDEVILLNEGKILFQGEPQKLTHTMHGKVFKIVPNDLNQTIDKRTILKQALSFPSVKDGVILGNSIKVVCEKKEDLPQLEKIQASNCRYEEMEASFEDGFLNILGVNFDGVSVLANLMNKNTQDKNNSDILIEAKHLTKKFGKFTATDDVNFEIKKGEIFGFLGPNGAGKSTTFKMLCGLLKPTSGEANVLGYSLEKSSSKARLNIGYMSQKFSLYGNISVIDNLKFFAGIYGLKGKEKKQKIQNMLEIFSLDKYKNTPSKDLPLGYKQRLSLSCAVMHEPAVLFLDEPTSGIDPITRREFWTHIYAMVQKGVTIMVTTHFMDEAEYCDRIALIYKAKAIALGTPGELISQVGLESSMEDVFIELIKRDEMSSKGKA